MTKEPFLKKIAVVTASGMGDGLIMHIASHNLAQKGFQVTTFNDHLPGFGQWLNGYTLSKNPMEESFDAILLQHDNSPKAQAIKALNKPVYTLYGSHKVSKHGPLTDLDFVCDPTKPMGNNVQDAITKWFGSCSMENGMHPPSGLIHRKYPKRIAIAPKSQDPKRNWPMESFEKIATHLKQKGYDPIFVEKETHLFPSLEELASFLYESGGFIGNDSGPGHLASCLGIQSLIIGRSHSHLLLWQPAWKPPIVITPPRWTSHFRWTRNHWKSFIPTNIVKKSAINITLN